MLVTVLHHQNRNQNPLFYKEIVGTFFLKCDSSPVIDKKLVVESLNLTGM